MAQMYSLVTLVAIEFLFQVIIEQEYLQVVPTIGVFVVFWAGFLAGFTSRYHRWEGL